MSRSRFPVLTLTSVLAVCVGGPLSAAPNADPDYETIVPAHATTAAPSAVDPAGLAASPLVVPPKATGLRRRFVLRDGTILIGQVLAFDGQMYALRLTHSTALVRRDLFLSIGPVTALAPKRKTVRVAAGARS